MPKICIISRNFPPAICGVGDYSYRLAENLKNKNNEIHIITSDEPESRDFPVTSIGNSWTPVKLLKTVGELKPDFIILQYVCQMYGRAGIIPGLLAFILLVKLLFPHTKLLVTFHELWIPLNPKELILGIIQRLQTGIIILAADAGIVTTISREKAMRKLFSFKKIYKIPVGSNIPAAPIPRTLSAGDGLTLSTFGRIHPERDLISLIKAVGIIYQKYDNVKLKIIGKIDECEQYFAALEEIKKQKLEKNISWTSTCSNDEILAHLRNSHIYISPELDGASGRRTTMMAALSIGLPIIAYDGYDTEKILKNGENIILIPPKNPEILAENIIKLANNENLRIKLGINAGKTFENFFSWEKITKQYEKILNPFDK